MITGRTAKPCSSDPACFLLPSADSARLLQELDRVNSLQVPCRLCSAPHEVQLSSIRSLGLEQLFTGIYHGLHAVDAPAAHAVEERIDGRVAVLGTTGQPEFQQPTTHAPGCHRITTTHIQTWPQSTTAPKNYGENGLRYPRREDFEPFRQTAAFGLSEHFASRKSARAPLRRGAGQLNSIAKARTILKSLRQPEPT